MIARLERAVDLTRERGLDALLVGVGPDLRYLTGYVAMPLERLTMLVVTPAQRGSVLVVPRLEQAAALAGLIVDIPIFIWNELSGIATSGDPYAIVGSLVVVPAGRSNPRVAVSDRLWASHLLRLQAALPFSTFEPASSVLRELRMIKDEAEIDLLRRAAQAADRVVETIAHGPLVGRTEADVAREVRDRLIAEGHETAEFAIIASGPNSASPHHEASDRIIAAGEPIVVDIGGALGGYSSDVTRTIWVTGGDPSGGPDATFVEIFELVREAQSEGTAAARPGTPCERIDQAARAIITAGGYGERFIHRTGHGIGLEGHEDPYLVAGNDLPLAPGMTFSVEPGIYIEGHYGVRIEDIVVCTAAGPVSLNEAPRDLLVVDG
ncbi:MAG TPA: Xaa-Pro peptidase family protein [Candidatus Limnocylindrales bacterium]|nr:Xaa-Pro peptidase family protein [Candidatus Limnocylindrales bacterium]